MKRRPRIVLTIAPPIGIALLAGAIAAATVAGAAHPALWLLTVFAVAFPPLWIALATVLSLASARALRIARVNVPTQVRALGSFRLALTLTLGRRAFPAIGVLTNVRFASDGVAVDAGPWAEIPLLETGRAATAQWDVFVKRRGMLFVGPFRAAVELPGSAIRATAIFERKHAVVVLPATYRLAPFVDALLAGRRVAVGRFQKLPTATEEYVGAREYRPGDSPKLIHRILSLRTRDPNDFYVREFTDPNRDDLSIVLDTAPPVDGDETLHRYRLEKAICFACALCRAFAARRLTVRFVYQRGPREVVALRLRPLDADLDRLDKELTQVDLAGDRATLTRVVVDEVRRNGAAVIFVSLRSREAVQQQRLPLATLTPDHVPVFTREIVGQ